MKKCITVAAAFVASLSFAVPSVSAQDGPRVIELDEIDIEGRVQRPNAFYILNRSQLGYEVLDLRTSFVRDIVHSVEDEAF